ncbi:MAG: serine/threonine-protein kinase, partial [Verrucomicrobiota bacterium]
MPTEGFTPFDDYGSDSSIRGLVAGQKVLKRYTLKRVLGRGGMGVVWLVHDDQLERDIAFKFLPDIVYHDKAAVESLKRETRRSLELTHPNIVRIYDFAQDEHCAGISMEYVAGDTLSNLRVCQPTHVFEVSDLAVWVKQLGLALDYAHKEARVAHRDLKPANLMLNNKGVLKIADFGISRSISDNMTRVSSAVHGASGTLVYMSPQQAMGEAASAQDDIYSLGATLFELLTSKPPFFTGEIMSQVREKTPPTMAERRKQLGIMGKPIPPEWEETVAACLAKDPAKRPQTALEVLQRLGLAETAGMEAAGLTTTRAGEVVAEAAAKEQSDLPVTELAPLMQIDGPEAKTTTRPAQPPMEFIIDSKGFKPVGPAEKVPQTTKPQRVARRTVAALLALLLLFVAGLGYWTSTEHQRLKAGMGGIEVTALPPGATVRLANGKSLDGVGKIMDLSPGVYEVMVEKADHEPQKFSLEVSEGKFTALPKVELMAHLGSLVLVSDPAGARFSIGGAVVKPDADGKLLAKLSPGVHEITAEYAQWPTVKRTVTVTKDAELKELFEFYPGRVEITSDPAGAKVLQNGKERGETPLILTNEPPGGVLFTLVKDDYNQETVRGEVRGKQPLRLSRQLTKEQGTLLLSSSLPGVSLYIDGRSLGQLGASLKLETNVSPGRHEITAIVPGWPPQEQAIEVVRGKVSPVQFEFAPAAVMVTSEPAGATIILRGVPMERTPFTMKEVKPGAFNLLLQMEGYDPVTIETNVLSGETLKLHAVLPRMSRPFRIRTTPADAMLAMDDIPLTNRPPSFTVGKHTLRIERDGYKAREIPVEIKAEGLNDFGEHVLERTAGDLVLVAQPVNATYELSVNRIPQRAKVAERLSGIPTGKHQVLVKAEGYDSQIVEVEVVENQTTTKDKIVLSRSKGALRILTIPEGAGYSLSGPDQVMRSGKTPNDEPQLPTGTYQVTFTMAGFEAT